ncbi:AraC family transcriptional regulator [Bradyrhizobium sp. CCGUVB1N3]|uniref:AraC family transcriptional regulator n=1 Tax=Bradyrhizobium sp. CCGUVB1N3 TaxID=2949629 RepID=UPI0020B3288C|nr:AraC family transcriptional regulator [Bradyrhizobium sp. CCGUVB1N3]MCP3473886.1 AraC family transcriptional regulator [Bradyrhizobium sp. CCGUVB1N3]
MQQASAPNFFVNTYTGAPHGRDYERWREELCRCTFKTDIQPGDGGSIDCKLQISLLGGLALVVPSGSSAEFSRTREILNDGCDDMMLGIATSGRVLVRHDEQSIELSESQMGLGDMSVPGGARLNNECRFKTIRIPRSLLLSICPKAEDRLGLVLGGQAPIREAIVRYHALAANLGPHTDVVGQHLMAQHMVDLVALLLGTDADRTELANKGHSAVRLELMRADVIANLSRGDLTIYSVAQKAGVSPRHAQRMFEQTGSTFTEFLLEQRLLLVRKLLLDPLNRWRKVSDLAHSAGFPDVSYFNRVFRRRFGVTPSDMRGA